MEEGGGGGAWLMSHFQNEAQSRDGANARSNILIIYCSGRNGTHVCSKSCDGQNVTDLK